MSRHSIARPLPGLSPQASAVGRLQLEIDLTEEAAAGARGILEDADRAMQALDAQLLEAERRRDLALVIRLTRQLETAALEAVQRFDAYCAERKMPTSFDS